MSIVNSKVILDDQDAARECFRLILDIDDKELADALTTVVSDALMAKYRKGLDDGCNIGRGK
tara:strand:+ start:308 stop:493 length:186 start_codon:yes stop_codon:yes gene_type:complete